MSLGVVDESCFFVGWKGVGETKEVQVCLLKVISIDRARRHVSDFTAIHRKEVTVQKALKRLNQLASSTSLSDLMRIHQ